MIIAYLWKGVRACTEYQHYYTRVGLLPHEPLFRFNSVSAKHARWKLNATAHTICPISVLAPGRWAYEVRALGRMQGHCEIQRSWMHFIYQMGATKCEDASVLCSACVHDQPNRGRYTNGPRNSSATPRPRGRSVDMTEVPPESGRVWFSKSSSRRAPALV